LTELLLMALCSEPIGAENVLDLVWFEIGGKLVA